MFYLVSATASIPSPLRSRQSSGGNDSHLFMILNPHVGNFTNKAKWSKCNTAQNKRANQLLPTNSYSKATSASTHYPFFSLHFPTKKSQFDVCSCPISCLYTLSHFLCSDLTDDHIPKVSCKFVCQNQPPNQLAQQNPICLE